MKKSARFLLMGVGLAAAGGAYMLMNRAKPPQPVIVQASSIVTKVESEQVLVATKDLGLGTLIGDLDVKWVDWPKEQVSEGMIRKSDTPQALEEIKGAVTRAPFFRGEPIRPTKVVKSSNAGFMSAILPSGSRAVAINIDASGATSAGGFILPNDRVDIIRTSRTAGSKGDYYSETILRNIRVLAIGQRVEEKNGERVVVGSNATLELTPRQSEKVVLAQRVGQLSLVLRSMLDQSVKESEVETAQDDPTSAGVTIVRFGIPSSTGN
ncbi:MAG: Flp pilus assembly protein CpaB [Beijerinckiaceae bacterium]